eukprot:COSAG01_NODE_74466_length_212_cov_30.008850_1_plen_48_part_01
MTGPTIHPMGRSGLTRDCKPVGWTPDALVNSATLKMVQQMIGVVGAAY